MAPTSMTFSEMVRVVSHRCRALGGTPPAFRTNPPEGMTRSLRTTRSGVVISVLTNGDWERIAADIAAGASRVNPGFDPAVEAELTALALGVLTTT